MAEDIFSAYAAPQINNSAHYLFEENPEAVAELIERYASL
jgi:hypothetical protein